MSHGLASPSALEVSEQANLPWDSMRVAIDISNSTASSASVRFSTASMTSWRPAEMMTSNRGSRSSETEMKSRYQCFGVFDGWRGRTLTAVRYPNLGVEGVRILRYAQEDPLAGAGLGRSRRSRIIVECQVRHHNPRVLQAKKTRNRCLQRADVS